MRMVTSISLRIMHLGIALAHFSRSGMPPLVKDSEASRTVRIHLHPAFLMAYWVVTLYVFGELPICMPSHRMECASHFDDLEKSGGHRPERPRSNPESSGISLTSKGPISDLSRPGSQRNRSQCPGESQPQRPRNALRSAA
jgi:hypothetical protein